MDYYFAKVLLLGDSGVGKSSLLTRYIENKFSDDFMSTIGVDLRVRTLRTQGRVIKVQLWDTAGQERFHSITSSYYRGAQGVLLVYDVSDRQSFLSLDRWLRELRSFGNHAEAIVVGNKSDLPAAVDPAEAERWAKANRCGFFQVSCKHDSLVALFEEIAYKASQHCDAKPKQLIIEPPPNKCC